MSGGYVIAIYLLSPHDECERCLLEGPFESSGEAHARWRRLFGKYPSARVEKLGRGDELVLLA